MADLPRPNFFRVPKPSNANRTVNFSKQWVAAGILTAIVVGIVLSAIAIARAVNKKKKKGPSCSDYDNRPAGCACKTGAECKSSKCKKGGKCA